FSVVLRDAAGVPVELCVTLKRQHTETLRTLTVTRCAVVYRTTADNYFAPKTGYNAPTQPVLEGARPWSHTCFITSLPCWHSHGSSFCCMSLGPSQAYPPHPCQRSPSAHAPPSPNRLRASRKGLTVLCVSERPCIPPPLLRCRPNPCP